MKQFLAFIALFAAHTLLAQDEIRVGCEDKLTRIGPFQYQQLPTGGQCFLSVHVTETADLIYRSFLFTSEGDLMVFNSYGFGNSASDSGARMYTFFPRKKLPMFTEKTEEVEVRTANPQVSFSFSKTKVALTGSRGATFFEDFNVTPYNKGGLEVKIQKGILLDAGFSLGMDPRANKKGRSKFTDGKGNECTFNNTELFSVSEEGDVLFKRTDQELKELLNKTCPQIQFRVD